MHDVVTFQRLESLPLIEREGGWNRHLQGYQGSPGESVMYTIKLFLTFDIYKKCENNIRFFVAERGGGKENIGSQFLIINLIYINFLNAVKQCDCNQKAIKNNIASPVYFCFQKETWSFGRLFSGRETKPIIFLMDRLDVLFENEYMLSKIDQTSDRSCVSMATKNWFHAWIESSEWCLTINQCVPARSRNEPQQRPVQKSDDKLHCTPPLLTEHRSTFLKYVRNNNIRARANRRTSLRLINSWKRQYPQCEGFLESLSIDTENYRKRCRVTPQIAEAFLCDEFQTHQSNLLFSLRRLSYSPFMPEMTVPHHVRIESKSSEHSTASDTSVDCSLSNTGAFWQQSLLSRMLTRNPLKRQKRELPLPKSSSPMLNDIGHTQRRRCLHLTGHVSHLSCALCRESDWHWLHKRIQKQGKKPNVMLLDPPVDCSCCDTALTGADKGSLSENCCETRKRLEQIFPPRTYWHPDESNIQITCIKNPTLMKRCEKGAPSIVRRTQRGQRLSENHRRRTSITCVNRLGDVLCDFGHKDQEPRILNYQLQHQYTREMQNMLMRKIIALWHHFVHRFGMEFARIEYYFKEHCLICMYYSVFGAYAIDAPIGSSETVSLGTTTRAKCNSKSVQNTVSHKIGNKVLPARCFLPRIPILSHLVPYAAHLDQFGYSLAVVGQAHAYFLRMLLACRNDVSKTIGFEKVTLDVSSLSYCTFMF